MKRIQVGAGILFDGERILACQRAAGGTHPGKWEFPGGKREPGETMEECLARELLEELGVRATVGLQVWHASHRYEGGEVELFFYAVEEIDRPPTNRAFAAIRWVSPAELARLDLLEADRPLADRLAGAEIPLTLTRTGKG
jgi:8-oxo-dGTP diphosphatase